MDIRAAHDGKDKCYTVEYTTALLYSDWLYFLWHGINISGNTQPRCLTHLISS